MYSMYIYIYIYTIYKVSNIKNGGNPSSPGIDEYGVGKKGRNYHYRKMFGIRPALFQGRNSGSGADFSSPLPLLLGYVMLLSYESI